MTTATLSGPRVNRRKKTQWWLWLILVAVIGVGGYVVYDYFQPTTAAVAAPTTSAVTRGDLASTVAATGNLEPASQVDVNLATSGVAKDVLVKVGDAVEAGQALVRLETNELALNVTTAQASLDSAKIKLEQAQQGAADTDITAAQSKLDSAKAALAALYAGPTESDLASAQAQLTSAQAQLTKTRQGSATAADIASAQSSVTTAQANLDKVKAGATEQAIYTAQQNVEKAKNALWAAQSSRDSIGGRTKDPDNDSSYQNAKAQVNQQESALLVAQNDLNALLAGPSAYDVTVAEQNLKQAQASLQKLTTINPNDVTVAQQSVNQAQANLDALKQGPTADNVAQAEATVVQAQASLDALLKGPDTLDVQVAQTAVTQAEAQLKQTQLKLEQATLTAPFAGVVTAVTATVGATLGTSSAPVQISDLNNLQIETQVSELDRAKLKVGQTVNIKLEAVSGVTLQGEIASISPTGTASNGVVNYPVTVKVTKSDPSVAAGMTASLTIVLDSKQAVLQVPNRAIQTVNNQKVVTVLRDGATVQVPVTTGLTDGAKTEVSSADLMEGDLVVTSTTGTSSTASTTTTNRAQGAAGVGGLGVITGGGAGGPPPGR